MPRAFTLSLATLALASLAAIGIYHGTMLAESPESQEFAPKDDKPVVEKPAPRVTFQDISNHHVSEEIFGTWKVDAELTKRINGSYSGCDVISRIPKDELAKARFVFSKDEAATKRFETVMNELLEKAWARAQGDSDPDSKANRQIESLTKIWATGRYDFGAISDGKGAFGIFVGRGMPTIFYIPDSENGKPNMESTLIQIARDAKGDQDILVYGGEFASESPGFMVRDLEAVKGDAPGKGEKPADKPAEAPKAGPAPAK